MKTTVRAIALGLVVGLASGCGATLKSYVKPEAPWGSLKRFAVVPFNLPSENPVERQLVTQIFSEELRRSGFSELTEVPLESPVGTSIVDLKAIGKKYGVDGVFSGSVDDSKGTVVHVRLQDVATEELVWSASYTFGPWLDYVVPRSSQQKFRRVLSKLLRELEMARAPA